MRRFSLSFFASFVCFVVRSPVPIPVNRRIDDRSQPVLPDRSNSGRFPVRIGGGAGGQLRDQPARTPVLEGDGNGGPAWMPATAWWGLVRACARSGGSPLLGPRMVS